MLPDRLIDLQVLDDLTRAPSWLSSRDEVWLRVLCDEIEACFGRPASAVDVRMRAIGDRLEREHAVARRRIEAVWLVERRRWRKLIDAPVDPTRIRSVVFDFAARHERGEALALAGRSVGIDPSAIARYLFADRED